MLRAQGVIKAHKSQMERMVGLGDSIITASQLGTIRMWFARDLATEGQRVGVLQHTASTSSLGLLGGGPAMSVSVGLNMGRKGSVSSGRDGE